MIPNGHQVISNNGTKERSIRTTRSTKNSPKLSPKVKRLLAPEESSKPEQQLVKPISSGIPKPTAAVKGTAKIIPKPAAQDAAALRRTPGDGKEVAAFEASRQLTPADEPPLPCKASESSSTAHPAVSDASRLPQTESTESAPPEELRSQVAKVLPMSSGDCAADVDEEDVSMNVQPMTPLFSALINKRTDPSSPTTAAKRAANGSYADPLDGYLSESGASLYARKLHYLSVTQRNKDNDDR